jgi:hypothetical protein
MHENQRGVRMKDRRLHRFLRQAQDGDELAHTIGAVVEGEEGVAV